MQTSKRRIKSLKRENLQYFFYFLKWVESLMSVLSVWFSKLWRHRFVTLETLLRKDKRQAMNSDIQILFCLNPLFSLLSFVLYFQLLVLGQQKQIKHQKTFPCVSGEHGQTMLFNLEDPLGWSLKTLFCSNYLDNY